MVYVLENYLVVASQTYFSQLVAALDLKDYTSDILVGRSRRIMRTNIDFLNLYAEIK